MTHKGDVRCGNDLWRGTAVPPFPCRDVEVTEISATEAVVTWENPFPQQVGGYTVLVKKHDSDEEAVEYPVPEGNGLREVLRNLKPDTRYTVDVRARNSAGESSWWGTPETGSFKTPGALRLSLEEVEALTLAQFARRSARQASYRAFTTFYGDPLR